MINSIKSGRAADAEGLIYLLSSSLNAALRGGLLSGARPGGRRGRASYVLLLSRPQETADRPYRCLTTKTNTRSRSLVLAWNWTHVNKSSGQSLICHVPHNRTIKKKRWLNPKDCSGSDRSATPRKPGRLFIISE